MIDQLCVFHSVVTIKIDQLLYDRSVVRIFIQLLQNEQLLYDRSVVRIFIQL